MSETADEAKGDLTSQMVTERFATIICADNSKAANYGRGLSATTVLQSARQQMLDALIGWTPVTKLNMDSVRFASGQHLLMNNARIWHQYEWTMRYFVNGADPTGSAAYQIVENIIRNYWPEIDARKIKMIATNVLSGGPINVDDPTTYEIAQAMSDSPAAWIKTTQLPEDRPPDTPVNAQDPISGKPVYVPYSDPSYPVEADRPIFNAHRQELPE